MADDYAGTPVDSSGYAGTPVQPAAAPQQQGGDGYAGTPVGQKQPFGAAYGGGIWGGVQQVAHGMEGSYQSAVTNGLLAQPVKTVMDAMDTGGVEANLRQKFPGQTDQWYDSTKHQVYNSALQQARQSAQQETQDNPYAGHQVGNFVAGALGSADPSWFLNPGEAIEGGLARSGITYGANAATHLAVGVGSHAAGMAAVGATSNAAAQLMDMAAGAKKQFDINEDLQAAGYSAAFGGAMRAASPFVAQLFGARGTNTTPGADPRGSDAVPTTGEQLALNAQDHQTYMNLLNTGSVDDIKQFMQGKQGPQPSWTDVNAWVEHRDAIRAGGNNANMVNPDFNYENEYNRQTIQSHVDDQTAGWKNAPQVNVVHGPEDIADPQLRQSAMAQGASDPNSLGFLGPDGSVHMFSGRIADAAKLTGMSPGEMTNSVLFHEGLGHYGLQQQFGNKLDSTIQTMLTRNIGQFGRDVDAWQAQNPGAYGGDRIRAAEEVLANKSNNGTIAPSVMDGLSAAVRQFGRKLGMKLTYSDAEVSQIVRQSQQAVTDGMGRDVRGNGYKFMFTGPSAAGFDPEHPTAFTPTDGVPRNEISDQNASIRQLPHENGAAKLGDVIDHPSLFAEYPHLRDLPVLHTAMDGLEGAYSPKTHMMYLNSAADDAGKLSTILHETQHAIQVHEGYPGTDESTTSKEMSVEDYLNHPIEKEAYSTEDRLNMTTEQRIADGVRFARLSDIVSSAGHDPGASEELLHALDAGYVKDTRGWTEVRRDALDAGFSPSDIKDIGDVGDLSKKLWRMQSAGNMALTRISELNERIGTSSETAGDRVAYAKVIADLNAIVPRIMGNRSELGRALNTLKAFPTFSNDGIAGLVDALREADSGLGPLIEDPVKFANFAASIKSLMKGNNPAGALAKMQAVNKPHLEQYINTLHYNAMLSSLGTQVKAIKDMFTGITTNTVERAIAGYVVAPGRNLYEGVTGKPQVQGVSKTEVIAGLGGVLRAVGDMETYRATLHSALTGESSFVANGQRTPTNALNQRGMSDPHIPIVSIPTQLISAHDTFFRSVAMMENLNALGNREAIATLPKGASLDDIFTAGAGYARNPTPEMLRQALDQTNRTLLLNSNPVNKWLDQFRTNYPGQSLGSRFGTFVIKTLAPFIRVQSNSLFSRVIQRSPLGLLDPYTIGQINAGGAQSDMAMSRILYGSTKIGLYWAAAGAGYNLLTGNGPSNVDKYKENVAAGITPNSVHTKDGYVRPDLPMQINPFGLDNTTATMVKNMRDAYESGANKGQVATGLMLAFGSVMHDMVSQSWINDFKPAMDAIDSRGEDIGQKMAQFAGNEAKTFVPGAVQQATHLMNPNTLDTRPEASVVPGASNIGGQVVNSVASALPGNPAGLPSKYTVYGNPQQNGAGLFENGHTTETSDPAEQELHRISALSPTTSLITPVKREQGMTTAKYEDYQRLAGRAIVESVRQEMQDPKWQQMSDTDKWFEVKSIQKDMKKAAKEQVFGTS